jgi:class 3 adenylate cyclase/predicted negative regulator of RcsB-dependent stress response
MSTDSELVAQITSRIQSQGWEQGFPAARAELTDIADAEQRGFAEFLLGLLAIDRGDSASARQLWHLTDGKGVSDWAKIGEAFLGMRGPHRAEALRALDEIVAAAPPTSVKAGIAHHFRSSLLLRDGRFSEAMAAARAAKTGLGTTPFLWARVLDTLGALYAAKENPASARELFAESLKMKQATGDEVGLAVTYGSLGRLFFRWSLFDQAAKAFSSDLEYCRRLGDRRGGALMQNWLGKIELERQKWAEAAEFLAASVEETRALGAAIPEAFALQDFARALTGLSRADEARQALDRAQQLFEAAEEKDGVALVNHARGLLAMSLHQHDAAQAAFRLALDHFESRSQLPESAEARLQLALCLKAADEPRALVLAQLTKAIEGAERARRDALAGRIEAELKSVSEAEYYKRRYYRVRGNNIDKENLSLTTGVREALTVMYLDIKGSTEYGLRTDAEIVMTEFNEMMAAVSAALDRQNATISGYRGDGFLALFLGNDHAHRAVDSALDIYDSMAEFNLAREVLRKDPRLVRIGIHSGEAFLGNVGTYSKIDFTALGTTANLGARIEAAAEVGFPCISGDTHALVAKDYTFAADTPRTIKAKGFSDGVPVWDVVRRRPKT